MSCPCGASLDGLVCPDANGRPLCADAPSSPEAAVALLAEEWAASRKIRAEAPQVVAERRCASPPMGCGQPLTEPFRDEMSAREYGITGLCQRCQDEVFGALEALADEADETEPEED